MSFKDLPGLENAHIQEQTVSIRHAIREYIPSDSFRSYLRYFSETLESPSHKQALEKAFSNLETQTMGGIFDDEQVCKVMQKFSGNTVRNTLIQSKLRGNAADSPEIALTLAIFQAAHITYLSQLKAAIDRNSKITLEERDNSHAVINHSFQQFNEFLIFVSLLPLIIMKKKEIEKNSSGQTGEQINAKAITQGWAEFMGKKLLVNNLDELEYYTQHMGEAMTRFMNLVDPNSSNQTIETPQFRHPNNYVFCPASEHSKSVQKSGALEELYHAVHAHKDRLKGLLDRTSQVIHNSAENPDYEKLSQSTTERLSQMRGGKGIMP